MATSYETLCDEYDASVRYDVDRDLSLARRFVAACRGLLRHASMSRRDGMGMEFDQQSLREQEQRALAWISANESVSESARTANPNVLHADFSSFGQYGGDYR